MTKAKAKTTTAKNRAFPEVPVKDEKAKFLLTAVAARLMDLMHDGNPDIAVDAIGATVMIGVMLMKLGGASQDTIFDLVSDVTDDIGEALDVIDLIEELGLTEHLQPKKNNKASGANPRAA